MAKSRPIPSTVPGLLRYVGVAAFGAKCWRTKLAGGLGISESTLRLWLGGAYKSTRDIEGEIADWLDRECDSSSERAIQLGQLRRQILKSTPREAA